MEELTEKIKGELEQDLLVASGVVGDGWTADRGVMVAAVFTEIRTLRREELRASAMGQPTGNFGDPFAPTEP